MKQLTKDTKVNTDVLKYNIVLQNRKKQCVCVMALEAHGISMKQLKTAGHIGNSTIYDKFIKGFASSKLINKLTNIIIMLISEKYEDMVFPPSVGDPEALIKKMTDSFAIAVALVDTCRSQEAIQNYNKGMSQLDCGRDNASLIRDLQQMAKEKNIFPFDLHPGKKKAMELITDLSGYQLILPPDIELDK